MYSIGCSFASLCQRPLERRRRAQLCPTLNDNSFFFVRRPRPPMRPRPTLARPSSSQIQISIEAISLPGDKKGGRGRAAAAAGWSTLSFLVTHSLTQSVSQSVSQSVRGPPIASTVSRASSKSKSITRAAPACVVRSHALVTLAQKPS